MGGRDGQRKNRDGRWKREAEDPFRERERECARSEAAMRGDAQTFFFFFLNSISFHFILRRSYKSVRSFLSVGSERP